jgi:hypothetical protein
MIDRCGDPSGTEIILLVGARPYTLPERCAIELRDRIRQRAPDDRTLGYLADAIAEDLDLGECSEPLDLGHKQIEELIDILISASPDEPLQRLRQAANALQNLQAERAR